MLKFLIFVSVIQIIYGSPTRHVSRSAITYSKQTDSPWLALLEIKESRCGGSLINKKFILTAAHCFDEIEEEEDFKTDIKISLGEWKIDTNPDCEEDSDADVCDKVAPIPLKSVTIHEDYDKESVNKKSYDIAMITLKRPPRPSEIIQSIQLPMEDSCDFQGRFVTITGFGEITKGFFTNKKKKTDVSVGGQIWCKRELGTTFNIDAHFCGVGLNKITTCKGDSGSAVTTLIDDVPVLQGIVSFGYTNCEQSETPSAFLNVGCFIPWIEDQMSVPSAGKQKSKATSTTTTESSASQSNVANNGDINESDFE